VSRRGRGTEGIRRLRALAAWAALTLAAVAAAQGYDTDLRRAIGVVERHPVFASGLVQYPGWTASGYDAQDRYGVWRVDLANAGGEPIGWAQVHLATERVLAWEAEFGLEGEAYAAAEAAILAFLRHDADFVAFAGDVDERDWTWVGYESWRDTWVIHLERGPASLVVVLQSDHAWTRSLEDLRIVQIRVPAVVSVEDWRSRQGAEAIALAFAEPRVAAAVRGRDGWTTDVEALDRAVWRVRFVADGAVVAEADVDLAARVVVVRR